MISHRLRSLPVTGYYEYLSQTRFRVNVTPNEGIDSEETPIKNTPHCVSMLMENGNNKPSLIKSSSLDNVQHQLSNLNDKDVTKWSSTEVQRWVEDQCRKFELTKATTEKFQMNGQALVLLTKHDFLRRSPDGGEILYYALQRLINPNKFNSVRVGQSLVKTKLTTRQNPRIIELDSDTDEHNSVTSNSSSTKPIVEEPDDPPLSRSPDSDSLYENYQQQPQQQYPHSFIYSNPHIRQTVFTIPTAPTAPYYHQQQAYPNAYMYPQHPIHPTHPQMPQQQFFHAAHPQVQPNIHFMNQYYPMMAAQGILIEAIEHEEANNLLANGVTSPSQSNDTSTTGGLRFDGRENLYLVTMNGQRFIMTEEYIKQIVLEIQQQQQQ
ncbi:unnamed protein product, partial [Adineta steineri]